MITYAEFSEILRADGWEFFPVVSATQKAYRKKGSPFQIHIVHNEPELVLAMLTQNDLFVNVGHFHTILDVLVPDWQTDNYIFKRLVEKAVNTC
jgi:hypothetical protein